MKNNNTSKKTNMFKGMFLGLNKKNSKLDFNNQLTRTRRLEKATLNRELDFIKMKVFFMNSF